MARNLWLFAACALVLVFCLPGHGQDSPSLGDLARQAQKDKANANAQPMSKVITNDDIPSSTSFGSGPGLGRVVQPGTPGKPGTAVSPDEQLERMKSLLNELDSLDRATLAKNALQGSETDFPGRAKWEDKLFAAKQVFVSQGRDIMKRAGQLQESAKSVQDAKNPNDPRAKDLSNRLQQLVQQAVQTGAAFQAVVMEGKDLAGQSQPAH